MKKQDKKLSAEVLEAIEDDEDNLMTGGIIKMNTENEPIKPQDKFDDYYYKYQKRPPQRDFVSYEIWFFEEIGVEVRK